MDSFLTTSFCYQGFTIHSIAAGNNIIHLTFSSTVHGHGVLWLRQRYPESKLVPDSNKQHPFLKEFREYVRGSRSCFSQPPLSPFIDQGTVFQKKVWEFISQIPFGKTRTYGDIAKELGSAGYSRAVGQACHANPLALIIPCHRVVSSRGPGGFAGGISYKERLLEIEQRRKNILGRNRVRA